MVHKAEGNLEQEKGLGLREGSGMIGERCVPRQKLG